MGNEIQDTTEDSRESVGKKLPFLEQNAVQASVIVIASPVLCKVPGFARDILVGGCFGVSKSAGTHNAMLPVISICQNILTGALTVSPIALFLEGFGHYRKSAVCNDRFECFV